MLNAISILHPFMRLPPPGNLLERTREIKHQLHLSCTSKNVFGLVQSVSMLDPLHVFCSHLPEKK